MANASDRGLSATLCLAAGAAVAAAGLLTRPPWRYLVAATGAALAGAGAARLMTGGTDGLRQRPEHWSNYGDRALSPDDKLHGALQDTFPASDPPALDHGRTGGAPVH